MNPVSHQTQTIHPDNLQPGTYLIDRYQDREKVIRRVEPHDSFVQLFFQGDAEPFACSTEELQRRFEIVYPPFRADANLVRLVAEAYRLQHAYLFNPIFATETSLIDPLPHQFIAVYDHLLKHFPLRFLLADDAGAGKNDYDRVVYPRTVTAAASGTGANCATSGVDWKLGARVACLFSTPISHFVQCRCCRHQSLSSIRKITWRL